MSSSIAGRLLDQDLFPYREKWFLHPPEVARLLKDQWNGICREVATSGRLNELHAARGDLLAVFDQLIEFYKSSAGLLDLKEQLSGRNGHARGSRDELTRETDGLIRLRDEIFSHWHTADDLAEILVEHFPLSSEQLKAYADRHPPPQSWYDETDDPFAPPG